VNPVTDRSVVYGIHIKGSDFGFLHAHYANMQYLGLHTMKYGETRDKVGSPTFLSVAGEIPGSPFWNLFVPTDPVMRIFAKKAITNGPLLGLWSDYTKAPAAPTPYDTSYNFTGIGIRWSIQF